MIDLIVRGGYVITVDADRRVIADGAVAVDDGRIVAVGPWAEIDGGYEAARVIHEPHGVVLPGLVDAHSHAGHGLIRTMADDLGVWLDACERVYLHGATPDFWHAEAQLTATERLRFGTTTALSMFGGAGATIRSDDPEHAMAHAAGVTQVGLRSVLVVGSTGPPYPHATTAHGPAGPTEVLASLDEQLATVRSLAESLSGGRTRLATTFPTLTVDAARFPDVAAAAQVLADVAAEFDLMIVQDGHTRDSVHASFELGLLGPTALLSHATDLDDGAIGLLVETDTAIAHNPSAIFSQYGRCPVPELLEAGVTVGLGSDATAPDRSTDMFRHMFQLTRYHRVLRRDPDLFPPGTAIEMATIGSAKALGLDDRIGSLEPGKEADIVVVDTDRPHLSPLSHPVHQVVYFATGADVSTVVVGGEVLLDDGVQT
ncbi:MAG: amidohydrolase family protein, partial [Acidimicrobiia bacterium]|nr:amidohydrolase family protein [Acidimicrobiia bacterium]